MPERVQLSRRRGWRMPPLTVSVSRPGRFGNPFSVKGARSAGYLGTDAELQAYCVELFRTWLSSRWVHAWPGPESERRRKVMLEGMEDLRGKNLACWCKAEDPCHADVLLELANKPLPPAKG